ncbi:hypothetical protein FB566_5059 [Stackebrandtia endophytica]|uniref:DUF1877 family protein n=1 Tax=Stackebrandtia endophytica TaxID=1496996 RepID=A0A543B3S8_9ACTN|nr:hypothetical protein [Stackebrandtia endophytica]TQL79453.1 hypothetical protein FB566_5059 [Stackebrandtia endophytica]
MGVITDYFRAADADTVVAAIRAADGLPLIIGEHAVFDGVAAKGIDPDVVLGALIEAIGSTIETTDIDDTWVWPTTARPDRNSPDDDDSWQTGPWVAQLPETTRDLLATTADDDLPAVAARWVRSEELEGATADDMLNLLTELVGLARRARDSGEALFCWVYV